MSGKQDDGGVGPIPLTVLPDRLAAHFAGEDSGGPYEALRVTSAAWIRESGEAGESLGRVLLDLEADLENSYLLGQPNLVGMGVGAWGLAVDTPELANPMGKARGMFGAGQLRDFLDEGYADEEEEASDDPDALLRAIDLVNALHTLDGVRRAITQDAPVAVMENLEALCGDLERRLEGEAKHSRTVRTLRGDASWRTSDVARRFEGARLPSDAPPEDAPPEVTSLPRTVTSDPYGDATDAALALEPPPQSAPLNALRQQIATAATRAIDADPESPGGRLAVERARRLLAQETALTGGALAPAEDGDVDTIAIRHALAERETRTPRPRLEGGPGVTPAAGLPEIPILSSRGPKGRVIGYLAAGEQTSALKTDGGFVKVPAPGRSRPGWIASSLLTRSLASLGWRGEVSPPGELLLDPVVAQKLGGVPRDVARLATLVARETGVPLEMLLAGVGAPPPATPSEPEKTQRRRARGAAMARKRMVERAPITIKNVSVTGLEGPHGHQAAAIINGALAAIPAALDRRLQSAPNRVARLRRDQPSRSTLEVPVVVSVGPGDLAARANAIAEHVASVLVQAEFAEIDTLHLGVRASDVPAPSTDELFEVIQGADEETLLEYMDAEKKDLDGATLSRLESFFGKDFKDVAVFAGPMAGALARSIDAEAFTHGKSVFFDPKHFRPDTAAGEALLAHELTHTQQAKDQDAREKEVQAMVAEASYLGWLQPQGAPFALEDIDLSHQDVVAAEEVTQSGVARAKGGRQTLDAQTGPRFEQAKNEERVAQVLDTVRRKIDHLDDFEAQRLGKLARALARRLL